MAKLTRAQHEAKTANKAAADAKRKQFSRNKKKNWRKFLDTKEVVMQ